MTRALRFLLASLVLLVHVFSAPPLLAAGAFAAGEKAAERDDCCASGTHADTDADADTPQDPDDCCPNGCKHCPLSCCGGIPALVTERPADPPRPAASPASPARTRTRLAASDPSAIYHPPRA